MGIEYKECKDQAHREQSTMVDVVIIALVGPIHICFVCYFIWQLWIHRHSANKNPLIYGICSYIIASVLAIGVAMFVFTVVPFMQSQMKISMVLCQTVELTARLAGSVCYLSIIECFFVRLDIAFRHSIFEVSRPIRYLLRTVIWGNWLVNVGVATARIAHFNCWQTYNTGPLGKIPYYEQWTFWCQGKERDIYNYPIIVSSIITGGLHFTLFYMFVRRLHDLSPVEFDTVIEKSTVVSVSGILSSLAAFTTMLLSGNLTVIVFDLSFNCLLLYTLFDFASDTYEWMFRKIVNRIRAYLEKQSPNSLSSPRARAVSRTAMFRAPSQDPSLN